MYGIKINKSALCYDVHLTYLSLHHEDSLSSEFLHKLKNVEIFFNLHSLKHAVQDNEGSSPTHSSTAVDQQGTAVGVRVC